MTERFAFVIELLVRVAAARVGRHQSLNPMVLLLCPYLRRLHRRFDALVARLRAGELVAKPPRPRTAPAEPAAKPAALREPRPRKDRLPRRLGWLVDLVPEARPFGEHVRLVLADPEVAALLAASPQAVRLLRPFGRMMGVQPEARFPPVLFPPRRTRPAAAPRVPKPRLRPRPRRGLPTHPSGRVPSANWGKAG